MHLASRDYFLLLQYTCVSVYASQGYKLYKCNMEPVYQMSKFCILKQFGLSNEVYHERNQPDNTMLMPYKLLILLYESF